MENSSMKTAITALATLAALALLSGPSQARSCNWGYWQDGETCTRKFNGRAAICRFNTTGGTGKGDKWTCWDAKTKRTVWPRYRKKRYGR